VKAAAKDGLQNREQGSKEGIQQGSQCCKLGCFHCRRRGSRSPSSLGSDGGNGDQCGQDGSGFCQPGADKVANSMPPQAKSMSTMWMLVMAAAAIGLLLIWASGKG
jgi:hypothetical protein